MEPTVTRWVRLLFGRPQMGSLVVFFSARLDETGTDGRSPYAIVAGGVSEASLWDGAEASWAELLRSRGVSEFHSKEWWARSHEFAGWSDLKRRNFVRAQERILKKNVIFTVAVAVHRDTHKSVKSRMSGIRGFRSNSDVGMCFRAARFLVCDKLDQLYRAGEMTTPPRVQFIVEDGPYSADSNKIYQEIVATGDAKYRPSKHSGMLAGFASIPHGQLKSLEIADYIAGDAISRLEAGAFANRPNQISLLMTPEFLEFWYSDMIKEREHRTAHGRRAAKTVS